MKKQRMILVGVITVAALALSAGLAVAATHSHGYHDRPAGTHVSTVSPQPAAKQSHSTMSPATSPSNVRWCDRDQTYQRMGKRYNCSIGTAVQATMRSRTTMSQRTSANAGTVNRTTSARHDADHRGDMDHHGYWDDDYDCS